MLDQATKFLNAARAAGLEPIKEMPVQSAGGNVLRLTKQQAGNHGLSREAYMVCMQSQLAGGDGGDGIRDGEPRAVRVSGPTRFYFYADECDRAGLAA